MNDYRQTSLSTVRQSSEAFSLIELLVVIAVVALMATLTAPSLSSMKRSLDLNNGTGLVLDQFKLARATARTQNRPVEVRIYLPQDVSSNVADAIQLFMRSADGQSVEPVNKKIVLPDGIAMQRLPAFSSLLDVAAGPMPDDYAPYYSVRFLPQGTVDVGTSSMPTLTMVTKENATAAQLPANFATLQFNPSIAGIEVFRP